MTSPSAAAPPLSDEPLDGKTEQRHGRLARRRVTSRSAAQPLSRSAAPASLRRGGAHAPPPAEDGDRPAERGLRGKVAQPGPPPAPPTAPAQTPRGASP